jgi:hypothetical protein
VRLQRQRPVVRKRESPLEKVQLPQQAEPET